jgi:hypothetical protein
VLRIIIRIKSVIRGLVSDSLGLISSLAN